MNRVEIVEPAVPAFLREAGYRPARHASGSGELAGFEDRIRLTARVYVNRIWRQFFGIGIVKTLDDVGSQGEWPKHPELLDWLARVYAPRNAAGMRDWDMKHLVRTIVMSATYRQSSQCGRSSKERDPDNRLLARQSRYRVDAERFAISSCRFPGCWSRNSAVPA
jgi:hypothetical protein